MAPILKVRDKDGKAHQIAAVALPTLPAQHAQTHKQGGDDPLTPASIGAADAEHGHSVTDVEGLEEYMNTPQTPEKHSHEIADVTGLEAYILELIINFNSSETITFTVNAEQYVALSGMTWKQFEVTSFNPMSSYDATKNEFRINGTLVEMLLDVGVDEPIWSHLEWYDDPINWEGVNVVHSMDVIENGRAYFTAD